MIHKPIIYCLCCILISACGQLGEIEAWTPQKWIVLERRDVAKQSPEDNMCRNFSQGNRCLTELRLVQYEYTDQTADLDSACCWRCESGKNLCVAMKYTAFKRSPIPARPLFPGMVLRVENHRVAARPDQNWCEPIINADFKGLNLRILKNYITWLAINHGGDYNLYPGDIQVEISKGPPPVEKGGFAWGQTVCYDNQAARVSGTKFKLVLFERSLAYRCKGRIYHTAAKQFKHILQTVDQNARCIDPEHEKWKQFDKEARAWANDVAPLCDKC